MAIQFNDQQLDAIKKAVKWYFVDSFHQQCFALGGLAGVGKTTVVNTMIKMLGVPINDVIFATLTAKASLVLRLKGNPSNTIHKSFYSVYKTKNSFAFSLKRRIPSNIRLIVIDEASMVNEAMLNDICSFGLPTLLIMDPGQVPPVFGTNKYVQDPSNLDVFLTKVMRQSDESGILDLAMKARNGEPLPMGYCKNSLVTTFDRIADKIDQYSVALCYSNKTRRLLNQMIREKKGYTSIYPQKGEKILCLLNNYNYELEYNDVPIYLINGLMGYVREDAYKEDKNDMELINLKFTPDFLMDKNDPNMVFNTVCFRELFEQYQKDPSKEAFIEELYNNELEDDALGEVAMIDYGYAFTVHKSQGSEYEHPLVVMDIQDRHVPESFYNRFLYTALTRGKQAVTVAFMHE